MVLYRYVGVTLPVHAQQSLAGLPLIKIRFEAIEPSGIGDPKDRTLFART